MSLALASGAPVSLDDISLAAYDAIRRTAVLLVGSALRWTSLRGASAGAALNGLVTNDVDTLADGASHLSVALTPKGKIVSDLIVVRLTSDAFLIGVHDRGADEFADIVRKYVNPRLAKFADETDILGTTLVAGPLAGAAVQGVAAMDGVAVASIPLLGRIPCYAVFAGEALYEVERELGPLVPGSAPIDPLVSIVRVEEGLPTIGRDMNETTLVQEAGLDTIDAVSFTKGCYTGQETVARVHFRGHVNRHLRGLTSEAPLPPGGAVMSGDGNTVGDVRSSIISPRLGPIALGMIRREIEVGAEVWVESEGTRTMARIVSLPFDTAQASA